MIYSYKYRVGIEEVGHGNSITNKYLLVLMQNAAGMHSQSINNGLLQVEENKAAWVLLDWAFEIVKRPQFNDLLTINTWSTNFDKISANRDYEILDEHGNTMVKGTSRWIYLDLSARRPMRLDTKIMELYQSETDKHVFSEKMSRITLPDIKPSTTTYKIQRRDIDTLGHMHNTSYLDIAYEVLPENIYNQPEFNNLRIEYKKEISGIEEVQVNCFQDNNEIYVEIASDKTHATIHLFN